jgi:hypothetical protein
VKLVRKVNPQIRIMPEVAKRLSGTHRHKLSRSVAAAGFGPCWRASSLWVPVFACRETGTTPVVWGDLAGFPGVQIP